MDVPDNEIRDILGRTAAKLFGLKNAKAFEAA
jgi:hypothetical protein